MEMGAYREGRGTTKVEDNQELIGLVCIGPPR
jgi:hypothetical protein